MSHKKIALIDADTALYRAAILIDERYITVKHTPTGKTKDFKSKTEFKDFIQIRCKDIRDYEIVSEGIRENEPIEHGCYLFKNSILKITEQEWCKDYMLYLGTGTNYRKDVYPSYKGNRGSKPTRYQQMFDFVINKYKDKVMLAHNQEAEDLVGIYGTWYVQQAIEKYGDPKMSEAVVLAIDKDTDMLVGWRANYDRLQDGVWFQDELYCYRRFCEQLIIGDSTDNIEGLGEVSAVCKAKYNIKYKGIGKKTAESLMLSCSTKKEMLDIVVDLYKGTHEENWKMKLNLVGVLVKIRNYLEEPLWNIDLHCLEQGWDLYD